MTGRHPYDLGYPSDAYDEHAAALYYAEFGILDYEEPEPLTEAQIAEDMIHAAQERDMETGCYD